MVAFQSMSPGRGRRVRLARLSAPLTAARVWLAIRCSISATTGATTSRAVARVVSGITWLRLTRVATRCTSGWTESQQLGLEQHRGQVEPLDGVPLHHLDDAGREVGPDVAQPAGHPRRRRRRARRRGRRCRLRRVGSARRRRARPGPRPSRARPRPAAASSASSAGSPSSSRQRSPPVVIVVRSGRPSSASPGSRSTRGQRGCRRASGSCGRVGRPATSGRPPAAPGDAAVRRSVRRSAG